MTQRKQVRAAIASIVGGLAQVDAAYAYDPHHLGTANVVALVEPTGSEVDGELSSLAQRVLRHHFEVVVYSREDSSAGYDALDDAVEAIMANLDGASNAAWNEIYVLPSTSESTPEVRDGMAYRVERIPVEVY